MMKHLLVMRHAKSDWSNATLSDHDRPLNKRGLRNAPRMGELLRDEELVPDLILCSSAKRAKMTAQRLDLPCQIVVSTDFYAADTFTWIEALSHLEEDIQIAMLIGHNPELEELVELLSGSWEKFPTAAIACFDWDIVTWNEVHSTFQDAAKVSLQYLWRPKEL